MKFTQKIKKYVVYAILTAMILSNQMAVNAASIIFSYATETILSDVSVSENIYLYDIVTLNNGKSFVGAFKDPIEYEYYYGVSDDLTNWELKSPYFSIAYGNGIFAGISNNGNGKLNYTLDGVSWETVNFDNNIRPFSIKFENGIFKLYAYDSSHHSQLLISEDMETWINITEDMIDNDGVENTIVDNNKLYTLVSEDGKLSALTSDIPTVNNTSVEWKNIDLFQKDGYDFVYFAYDGSDLLIALCPENNYTYFPYNYIYFTTSDFVNWEEKEWTRENGYPYDIYASSSTEDKDVSVDKLFEFKILPKLSNHHYDDDGVVQKLLVSKNSDDWEIHDVIISLNGSTVNKTDSSSTEIIIENGTVFNKDKTKLIAYLEENDNEIYTIPDGVEEIYDYAFCDCEDLKKVVIPDSVIYIGDGAFRQCDNLTSIEISDSVISIGDYAFYNCDSLTSIVIPDSVTSIGDYAFYNCDSLTSIVIPDSVTSIGDYAFYNCNSFTSIVIPDSVTSIGDYVFCSCSNLASVDIGNGVKSIGDYAFSYCDSLTSVDIGDGVKSIGDYAFNFCRNLTSIIIPDNVTSIDENTFRFCDNLTICGNPDSYAQTYANTMGINFSIIDISAAITGDANGDGKVDRKDLTRLSQYFARWDVEIDTDASDANGDGKVDRKDLTRLSQYFARWDVELGK